MNVSKPEPYGPPWPFDPIDMSSGVQLEEGGRELSFRELKKHLEREQRLYDGVGERGRLKMQIMNDPHWKPIEPGAGLKRRGRRA